MIQAESRRVLPVDFRLASLLRGEDMSPLYMDTGSEPPSPGSLSAEESHSNNAGSEREGEGQQTVNKGSKRQEKNRDAARKSRRKQTERADELHEELQGLERSNSALQKEIASLRKDLQLYTTALERHKPLCCLEASSSTIHPSADRKTGSSPRGAPPQVSSSTLAAAPSPSTSLTSLDCVESTHLSSSTPTPASSADSSSAEFFPSSSSANVPYTVSFSAVPAHSLFCEDPLSLIVPRPAKPTPVCSSLISNPSCSLTTAAQPQSRQGTIHESSSANACFSTLHAGALDPFLTRQVVPPYSHLAAENVGLVARGCPMNVPQLHPDHFRGNLINSGPLCVRLPPTRPRRDPALQSLSVSPQANPEPSYTQHVTPNPAPLLSLLTNPSPLSVSQTTSSSFDQPPSQPLPSLQTLGDPSRDLSLSELLEGNDWILQ